VTRFVDPVQEKEDRQRERERERERAACSYVERKGEELENGEVVLLI